MGLAMGLISLSLQESRLDTQQWESHDHGPRTGQSAVEGDGIEQRLALCDRCCCTKQRVQFGNKVCQFVQTFELEVRAYPLYQLLTA